MSSTVKIATDLTSTITLSDGVEMPLYGLGTFLSPVGTETEDAVVCAIENGYKMIDTAQYYKNEADVGLGIKRSGKSDIFVVSKVNGESHGYNETIASVKESIEKLGLKPVDLFLIHAPAGDRNVETYRALLDLKKEGLIRSAGVSNFGVNHLEGLLKSGLPPPSVNQIELHAYHRNEDIVKYCHEHNIAVMGYSPLTRCKNLTDPDLKAIADRHEKTIAQVLIRWSVQQGYITIPKSVNAQRIVENTKVFDFELDANDLKQLSGKPDFICGWNPTTTPWRG